jgi:hypothetical protein
MKRVCVLVLALIVPAMTVWNCVTPPDVTFDDDDDDDNGGGGAGGASGQGQGGAGGAGGQGQGGAGGAGSAGGATSSSSTMSSTTTSSTTVSSSVSSGTGGACDEVTCQFQCFSQLMCGMCVNGACQCMPLEQCGFPGLDAGLPMDGGFDLDGAFPGAF